MGEEMTENKTPIDIYNLLSQPPKEALREIKGGKLNGKTNINPQWRYKAMTEAFGLAGIGWKYEVQKLWTEQGAGAEKLAFAQVAVYIKNGDEWSEPIVGIGGSKLVTIEKGAPVSNDEGYKMAVTDAFSTALKMIGVASAIYMDQWDGHKYRDEPEQHQGGQHQGKTNARPAVGQQQGQQGQQIQQQQPAPHRWSQQQVQELGAVLGAVYPDGSPVFSEQDKVVYNKFYNSGIDFNTSIKQARDTRDMRLQEAEKSLIDQAIF